MINIHDIPIDERVKMEQGMTTHELSNRLMTETSAMQLINNGAPLLVIYDPRTPNGTELVAILEGSPYAALAYARLLELMESPAPPSDLSIARFDGQLTLNWTHSASPSNAGTRIVYKTGSPPNTPIDGAFIDVSGSPGAAGTQEITGLVNGTTYFFALFGYNDIPRFSLAIHASAAPIANVGAITNFMAGGGNERNFLSWTNPGGSFTSVMIRRNTGNFPASINDGTQIYSGTGTSYVDMGLTNGTQYFYRAFPTNGVNPNTTTIGQQVSATPNTFSASTWAQITASSAVIEANTWTSAQINTNFGWDIGDRKTVAISGANYDLKIIGFRHDNRTSGGVAGITLELGVQTGGSQAICFGTTTADRRRMEAIFTNANGWNGCEMRRFLNATGEFASNGMLQLLPTDLRSAIKQVNKPTAAGGQSTTIINSPDNIFLLSPREVFGTNSYGAPNEGTRYAWYADNDSAAARIRHQPMGTAFNWYLRSPSSGTNHAFTFVESMGNVWANNADMVNGVSFALCV